MDTPPREPDSSEESPEKKVKKRLAKKDSFDAYQEALLNMQKLAESVTVDPKIKTKTQSFHGDLIDQEGAPHPISAIISARPRISYFSDKKKAPVFESRIFVHTRLEQNLADPRLAAYLKPEDLTGYVCTVGIGESAQSFAIFTQDKEQAKTIHTQILKDLEKTGDTAFDLLNHFFREYDEKRHKDKSLPILRKMDPSD